MPLDRGTKSAIYDYLLRAVTRYVQQALKTPGEKPFHSRLLPVLGEVRFSERSFSTRTGSWFQAVALSIAKQFHKEAHSPYLVHGRIRPAAEALITDIVEAMDHGSPKRKPNRQNDIEEVMRVQSPGGTEREVRSDLFVLRHDGSEMYFELKTPGANKGQCKRMKQDILTVMALRLGQHAEAFAASAYNPYGDTRPYVHGYAMQFLEIGKDILVGREFWTKIGDAKTYDELLEICEAVGAKVTPLWKPE